MHDPIAAGRRRALRAVAVQAVVAVPVALAFLVQGTPAAWAAAAGGAAMAVGNGLAAVLSLRGIERARVAFARLLVGVLAKWCAVVAILATALHAWRLPPLPMLCGLGAGLLAWWLALDARWLQGGNGGMRGTGSATRRREQLTDPGRPGRTETKG